MIRKNSAARTFLCLLLAFVFAASCLPQTIFATTDKKTVTTWPEGPENNSGAVCLLDADTGAVLYDKNMDEQRYPASITKILTALLIIENKQMTDTVTFGTCCQRIHSGKCPHQRSAWRNDHSGGCSSRDSSCLGK